MDSASQAQLVEFTTQAAGAAWPFFIISSIIFGLRCIARIWYTQVPIGWDDIVIGISWILDVVRMVSFQLCLNAARHVNPANLPGTVPDAIFWALFTDSWSFISVTLPKVGVAILLVRIFRPRTWVRNTILSMAIGLFVYCIVGLIICYVECSPVAGQWNPWKHPETKCWPRDVQVDYSLVGSSSSAFLDLAFAIYPGFVIWKLQMPTWQKLVTIGLMGLGLISFAIALIKVYNNTTLFGDPTVAQLLYHTVHIGLWNSIENDFVLMAACLPSIRPLFGNWKMNSTKGRSFTSFTSTSAKSRPEEHVLGIAHRGESPGLTKSSLEEDYTWAPKHDRRGSDAHGFSSDVYEREGDNV